MKKRHLALLGLTLLLTLWLGTADWGMAPEPQTSASVRSVWSSLLTQVLGPAD